MSSLLAAALAQHKNRQISGQVPKLINKRSLKPRLYGFFGSLISNLRMILTSEVTMASEGM